MEEHSNYASMFPEIMVLRGLAWVASITRPTPTVGMRGRLVVPCGDGTRAYRISVSQLGDAGSWMGLAWLSFVAEIFSRLRCEISKARTRLRGTPGIRRNDDIQTFGNHIKHRRALKRVLCFYVTQEANICPFDRFCAKTLIRLGFWA